MAFKLSANVNLMKKTFAKFLTGATVDSPIFGLVAK
jgi:hypothetical protein